MRSLLPIFACAVVVAACGGSDEPAATTITTTMAQAATTTAQAATTTAPLRIIPRGYDEFRAQPTACGADQPPPVADLSFAAPQDMAVVDPLRVTIETSCGPIVALLDPATAPETVNSFVFLAAEGYFDGSASHRVFPGFIIQAGDPTATGFGGPGYTLPDEFPATDFVYARGVLAMANSGQGTSGSQFFIVLADAPLPPQFSVFGSVVEGFDVLDAIAGLPLGTAPGTGDSVPTTPLETLYIERVSLER